MTFDADNSKQAGVLTVLLTNFRPVYLTAVAKFLTTIEGVDLMDAVSDGHDAAALEYQRRPDVIVCGFSLFVTGTLEPLRVLRDKLPGVWIIGTALDPDGQGEVPALANGADEYITGYELDTKLEMAINRRRRRKPGS